MKSRAVAAVALTAGMTLSAGVATAVGSVNITTFSTACAEGRTGYLRVLLSGGECLPHEVLVGIGTSGSLSSGTVNYYDEQVVVTAGSAGEYRVACPPGERVVNGFVFNGNTGVGHRLGGDYADTTEEASAWVVTLDLYREEGDTASPHEVAVPVRIICIG